MDGILLTARLILAVVFGVAGVAKLLDVAVQEVKKIWTSFEEVRFC